MSTSRAEYLIAAIRCARLRITLQAAEIDEVGIALRHGLATPEIAVQWLIEIDALHLVVSAAELAGVTAVVEVAA